MGPPTRVSLVDVLREEDIHMIHRAMVRRLGDRELAADATMDLFVRVTARFHRYDPERCPFAGWIWGFVETVAADTRRREARRLRDQARAQAAADAERHTDEEEATMHLPQEWRDAFARLDPRDRTLIVLRAIGGWSAADVAARLGMTVTGVNTAYHRACGRLATSLRLGTA
ncbi:RNA polymerase sigma factor [Miltoncostaea oceani]|jgi:RNA polymerase sigma factor (sigma-70 family)|uniref:RNA polymerase sigma factor n=1 Tax=Miltoncostaea oceani TaxID=2843216 RepID=UPI001C3E4F3F|nr:sigma-70 family RNA polymerase sigma factor [Miltoncostaea oceani]